MLYQVHMTKLRGTPLSHIMAGTVLFLLFLVILFASLDVFYFLRVIWLKLRLTIKRKLQGKALIREEEIFKPFITHGIVLPSDLDHMLHMNNSRYLREMDFGRIGLVLERGMVDVVRSVRGTLVLNAASVRYRRSMHVFERFTVITRVLCWEGDSMYLEQRMVRSPDDFITAVMYAKLVVRGMTMDQVVENLIGQCVVSPRPPPEIEAWVESVRHSSEALRKERSNEKVLNHFVSPREQKAHQERSALRH